MKYLVVDVAAESFGAMAVLKEFYQYTTKDTENEWIYILSDNYLEEKDNIKIHIDKRPKRNWIYRLYWDFFELPKIVKKYNPDRIISLQNIIAMRCKKYPQLLYMHMPLPFQHVKKFSFFKSDERSLALYQYMISYLIRHSIKKADATIVQGNWIKEEICRQVGCDDKVLVRPTQINIMNDQSNALYTHSDKVFCKQFFYPVAPSAFKNHECIFSAVDELVKRGITDFKVFLTCDNIWNQPEREQIVFLGRISRENVAERLAESVLLFPSYIETYGMPMVEARALGCAILASDCPFSHEVLNDYPNAYFFDPFKPIQMADLMSKVLSEQCEYHKQEFVFPTQYTWESIIGDFESFIDKRM